MKRYAIITNQQTKEVSIGLNNRPNEEIQKLWIDMGMSPQEVEQAYDGRWFLKGYAPEQPPETVEEVSQKRADAYLRQTDVLTAEYARKQILGILTPQRKIEIEQELQVLSAQIQHIYPYLTEQGGL